ncbi:MAG TPA: CHAT domain-containing protein, partial [Herpetosiphonaceae bacterium]|nr:CHAT domain-containing protein [Herpetosiphonaceae bacterium]
LLGRFRPHLLHIAGHGGLEGLRVADSSGHPRQLSAAMLGRLLRNVKSVQMVVLNGCELAATDTSQFGMAATLARIGIPTVVGMQFEISDIAALAFAEGFYEALGWGWPADEAISWARSRMTYYAPAPDVMEWVTPAVYVASNDVPVREAAGPAPVFSADAIYRGLLEITWEDDVVSDADQARLERKRAELGISLERAAVLEREVRHTLAEGALAAAVQLFREGDFEHSRAAYRRALLLEPENPQALAALRRWAVWPHGFVPLSQPSVPRIEELCRVTLPGRIFATAWSPDGQSLALATEWGLMIYAIRTMEIQFKLSSADVLSYSVAWSPDGRFLAAGGDNGVVRLWDLANLVELRAIRGPQAHIHALAWRPGAPHTLAVGDHEGTLNLWDVYPLPTHLAQLEGHSGAIYSLAWSPDGTTLASGAGDRFIHLSRPDDEGHIKLQGHADWVRRLAWSADGRSLASSSGDQSVCVWDAAAHSMNTRLIGHVGWVRGLAWTADASLLISGGGDGRVRIWDPVSASQIYELGSAVGLINDLSLRPDGRVLAVGSFEGVLTLWGIPPAE